MKKYIITWIIGLIAVAVAGRFMFQGKFLTGGGSMEASTNVFEFLPPTFDQLLYFSFDEELRFAMEQMETTTWNVSFQSLAEAVDQLIVIQSTDPVNPVSLMFFVNEQPVDITSLQEQGLIVADPTYVTKQLAGNVWIYGDATAVNEYVSITKKGAFLSSEKAFSTWATEVITDQYNVGMFAYAVTPTQVNPLANKFVQALRRTAVSSHLGKENAFGNVIMQFSWDIVPSPTEDFTPQLFDYTTSGAVAYIEIANLIELFGIDQTQFTTLAALAFNQLGGGAYSAILSNDDYTKLYEWFNNHFALTVAPSSGSLLGLGAQIVLADPELFPIFKKLSPIWRGVVGGLSGAAQVQEIATDSSVTYSSPTVPFSLLGQKIEIVRDQVATVLSIGELGSELSMNDETMLSYDENTIATFMIDTLQLQQAMAATQWIAPSVDQLWVGKYLQGGTVIANLSAYAEDDQLKLSFTVK